MESPGLDSFSTDLAPIPSQYLIGQVKDVFISPYLSLSFVLTGFATTRKVVLQNKVHDQHGRNATETRTPQSAYELRKGNPVEIGKKISV